MPILHEHFEPGSMIKELQAHNDMVTAMDFDVPFGTMVTAALDDTVRVWDLNMGRCMGFLEGHHGEWYRTFISSMLLSSCSIGPLSPSGRQYRCNWFYG